MKRVAIICVMCLAAVVIWRITGGTPRTAEADIASPAALAAESAAISDDYLVLVNADNPVSDDTPDFELVSAYHIVPLSTKDVKLEKETLEAVVMLFRAAKEAGIENLLVASGFRDRAEQQKIYDEAEDKSYVQLPGHSEHQTGLAADIAALGVGQNDFGGSEEGIWVAENAWKYGFILRYPPGKEYITGISYEPWHLRYVGAENAKNIVESGLCLEEYLISTAPSA